MPRQDAHKKTRKPANRRQKAKSLRRIPLSTVTIRQINTAPVPHTAALNPVIVVVLEQPEDREPRSAEEQIGADVDERSGAVQHPDDGDPETHGGDSGAEDEAVERSDVVRVVLVQEVGTHATFPVKPPAIARKRSVCQNVVDKPKQSEAAATPASPLSITGFRPIRSIRDTVVIVNLAALKGDNRPCHSYLTNDPIEKQ